MRSVIRRTPGAALDYAEIRDAVTLSPLETVARRALALVAARFGKARLIDNLTLRPATAVDSHDRM
jgi:pantoate--beta-alanine ligase